MQCRVSIVYPHEHKADQELWLTAALQHDDHVLLAEEKIKIQSAYRFCTIIKKKKS